MTEVQMEKLRAIAAPLLAWYTQNARDNFDAYAKYIDTAINYLFKSK